MRERSQSLVLQGFPAILPAPAQDSFSVAARQFHRRAQDRFIASFCGLDTQALDSAGLLGQDKFIVDNFGHQQAYPQASAS
ncbi:hypothetical protein [Xanthomonas campestris]|uniref:hypothetical protein n=1 Tax=Xanthomonas campestris TaxID=339 RepID=UPI00130182A2|nr:hypothetical protein [Xanthomonas campestris]